MKKDDDINEEFFEKSLRMVRLAIFRSHARRLKNNSQARTSIKSLLSTKTNEDKGMYSTPEEKNLAHDLAGGDMSHIEVTKVVTLRVTVTDRIDGTQEIQDYYADPNDYEEELSESILENEFSELAGRKVTMIEVMDVSNYSDVYGLSRHDLEEAMKEIKELMSAAE